MVIVQGDLKYKKLGTNHTRGKIHVVTCLCIIYVYVGAIENYLYFAVSLHTPIHIKWQSRLILNGY